MSLDKELATFGRFRGLIAMRDQWHCGFAENHGDPFCGVSAEWHGVVSSEDGTELMFSMFCCGAHVDAMRLSAAHVHELGSACGLPGSRVGWEGDRSWCWLPETERSAHEAAKAVADIRGYVDYMEPEYEGLALGSKDPIATGALMILRDVKKRLPTASAGSSSVQGEEQT